MRRVDQLFEEYSSSHQHPVNKRIHWLCIPLIFYATVGLLWAIPFPGDVPALVNWATIAMALALVYYVGLSRRIALGMVAFVVVCVLIAFALDVLGGGVLWISSLTIFVAAWIAQFVGHHVEGKRPSFLRDLQFLLLAPAWLLHDLYRRWGLRY